MTFKTRLPAFLLLFAIGLSARAQTSDPLVEQLRRQVAAQQEQIDELRRIVESLRGVTSAPTSQPVVPLASSRPQLAPPQASSALPDSEPIKAPTTFDLGGVSFTPTGWFDFSQVWRSKTVTSGLPTTFASIPYNNTVEGNRRQTLASAANTRMGLRMDTKVYGFRVMGIVETDFLGFTPGNVATTTNSDGMRLRLAFADVRKGKWELLAGQSWSLITPSRKGISPLASNLFLTRDLDPNIVTGLTWARTPQFRAVFHPKENLAMGISFESSDPYAGGSGGSGVSTLPTALAPNYFGQLNTGTSGLGAPDVASDLLAKIAWDARGNERIMHLEVAGLMNRFEFYNPLNNRYFTKVGGGITGNAGIEVVRHLTLFTNNYYSNGGGRYIFGQGPALIVRGDGSPSLVRAMSTVDGFEYQASRRLKLFSYYGGSYFGRNVAIDPANGAFIGYGYEGSPNSHNRSIQQIAAGFQHAFWESPNYGSFHFNAQYSWLVRHPWYVAPGQPGSANLNMLYLNLRYILPGEAPVIR